MTENRKRVSVSIESSGRQATASVTRGAATRTVTVAALPVRPVDTDPYTGPYTVTPGDAPVTLETRDLRMTENVTIAAIPSNYGKIGWNGSALTVS